MGTKVCKSCEKELDFSYFGKEKKGLRARCKKCMNAKKRATNNPRKESGTKFCPGCKQELDVLFFHSYKMSPDGLRHYCKECSNKQGRNKERKPKTEGTKLCIKCNVEHDVSNFYKNRQRADGLGSYCKPCFNEVKQDWRRRGCESEEEKRRDKTRKKTAWLVSTGKLHKQQCKRCDSQDVQAHHAEYDSADAHLNVTWLCPECHVYIHRMLTYLKNG